MEGPCGYSFKMHGSPLPTPKRKRVVDKEGGGAGKKRKTQIKGQS